MIGTIKKRGRSWFCYYSDGTVFQRGTKREGYLWKEIITIALRFEKMRKKIPLLFRYLLR